MYFTNLPVSHNSKFHFTFKRQVSSDRFLYDYLKAYEVPRDSNISKDVKLMDFLSLLAIEENLDQGDYTKTVQSIIEIDSGKKPKTREEFKIWNLIEIWDLIENDSFQINEDNYELIVHILFRNMGFDLDIKADYYRNLKTSTPFKNLLNPQTKIIDKEIQGFLNYIKNLNQKDIGGITQAGVILNAFLFIYPYKEFSITLAFIFARWYLKRNSWNIPIVNPMHSFGIHWDKFIKKVNESFEKLNLDSLLEFEKEIIKSGVNDTYCLYLFDNFIQSDQSGTTPVFPKFIDKVIAAKIILLNTNVLKEEKIANSLQIRNFQFAKEKEIKSVIQKMLDLKFLAKKEEKQSSFFELNDQFLQKIRLLLKEK
ncbi:hypothetical protein [Williamsoniiplasma lucivorax]|nr:hypothetical protein [Williamsoniiplasma lucivorax]